MRENENLHVRIEKGFIITKRRKGKGVGERERGDLIHQLDGPQHCQTVIM